MSQNQFETDHNGNIIMRPVAAWATSLVAKISLLVAFRYFDSPEALEADESKSIQLLLTPEQCFSLAADLTEGGVAALAESRSPEPLVH